MAIKQDWQLVNAILDYRNANVAVEVFNQGAKGIALLEKHPELQNILLEMHRAQDNDMTMLGIIEDMQGGDDGSE